MINVDEDYEELLKKELGKEDFASMSPEELSTAAKLMGKARVTTKEKETQAIGALQNIIIDGTGAAIKPVLKKKEELEALGYETFMIMIWVSPLTSLERNLARGMDNGRSLLPQIVLRTWRDVNKNVELYRGIFGEDFILINNDPEARLEYNPEYAKATFFQTVKGSGKQYSPEELLKKRQEIDAMNQEISNQLKMIPDFTDIEDAKTKINNFVK